MTPILRHRPTTRSRTSDPCSSLHKYIFPSLRSFLYSAYLSINRAHLSNIVGLSICRLWNMHVIQFLSPPGSLIIPSFIRHCTYHAPNLPWIVVLAAQMSLHFSAAQMEVSLVR